MPSDDELIAQHGALWARLDPIHNRVRPSVRPLLLERGSRAPESIGSAVLFRVDRTIFLLTARHVLDDFGSDPILIGGSSENLPAPGESRRTQVDAGGADRLDAAVLRVESGYLDELHSHCLTVDDIAYVDSVEHATNFLVVGFRSNGVKVDAPGRKLTFDTFRYADGAADTETYVRGQLDPRLHVALNYLPGEVVGESGRKKGPRPKGVSGGGIWHVPSTVNARDSDADRLVAIFTDHDQRTGILSGTQVVYHLELIRRAWPDVASSIARRFAELWPSDHGGAPCCLTTA